MKKGLEVSGAALRGMLRLLQQLLFVNDRRLEEEEPEAQIRNCDAEKGMHHDSRSH